MIFSLRLDPEDRLTTISSPAFSAAYDGDGLRAKKTAAGVTTYFVYDGSVVFDHVLDPQGSVVQRQTAGDYAAGAAAFDEVFYKGYGALRQDYSGRAGGAPAHHDPVGFGGQYGYYHDYTGRATWW